MDEGFRASLAHFLSQLERRPGLDPERQQKVLDAMASDREGRELLRTVVTAFRTSTESPPADYLHGLDDERRRRSWILKADPAARQAAEALEARVRAMDGDAAS